MTGPSRDLRGPGPGASARRPGPGGNPRSAPGGTADAHTPLRRATDAAPDRRRPADTGENVLPISKHPALDVQFVKIHGYRRAFVIAGTGPVLLLIHGIGDRSDTWRGVLPELARDHTVVAPDLLGHGQSDKPRADYSVPAYANGMRDLLSFLDIDRATVVGHSLGGGVAAQFAYTYPERCERLVLVSTGGITRSVSPLLRFAAAPNIDLMMPVLTSPPVRFAGRLVTRLMARLNTGLGRDAEEIIRVLDSLPSNEARRVILRTLRSGVDVRGQSVTMLDRAYLVEDVPTQIIWGAHDAIISVKHAYLAHAAMPGSRLDIFEEAGHFPHHVDPQRFVATIRRFIGQTEPAAFDEGAFRDRLRQGRIGQPSAASEITDDALIENLRSGS